MKVVEQVKEFAIDKLAGLSKNLCYHNAKHTEEVVEAVLEIGKAEQLDDQELEIVIIAAWMHDLGHLKSQLDHEKASMEMATEFLKSIDYPTERIKQVNSCIGATTMPQQPKSKLEEVMCDADLYHLGSSLFMDKTKLLKEEMGSTMGDMTMREWYEKTIEFVSHHQYFTEYARKNLRPQKLENLNHLMESVNEKKGKKTAKLEAKIEKLEQKLAATKEKETTPTRGIETMFRTTSRNHLDLSSIADQKANIMISINSIILSIVVSVLLRKLEEYPHFVWPTIILVVVCLVTIVLSIMVTRPQGTKGKFTDQDILKKSTNLLFFGNFHRMKLEEYQWGMTELMKDKEYLYGSLIQDIYFLGRVLGKKYRLLRVAYTIFMFGFVIAILSFLIAEVFFKEYYMYY